MRITALLIMAFCVCACKDETRDLKEESREKEAWSELDKLGLDKIKLGDYPVREAHLGGGLCVAGQPPLRMDEKGIIKIYNCYDSLPVDTAAPAENILRYRQGGWCFHYDCSIEPEKSFTVFMAMPIGFIESRGYSVVASRHSDSTMLYEYNNNHRFFYQDSISIKNGKKEEEEIGIRLFGRAVKKTKPEPPPKEEHIRTHSRKTPFIFFKEYDTFWEELFSVAKPLKMDSASLKKLLYFKRYFNAHCNLEFCSTKDILKPLYAINCWLDFTSKYFECTRLGVQLKPKCLRTLDYLLEEYDILMHSRAFPAGDCDLGNWRYIKIKDLGEEHNRKLKELMRLDEQGLE